MASRLEDGEASATSFDPTELGIGPGDVVAGKYRVERFLRAGGMGLVVAARHVQLDEPVALKFLRPDVIGHPEAVARFVREARAAVKIKSDHVARVTDVGQLEGGAPYMVMEFLEGGDLADWLRERGPLSVEQAVDFVLQASEAIAEAHALGIVHRDLKPANLFCIVRPDGELSIKVLDFGISKVTEPDTLSLTAPSAIVGSPAYMSPEQLQSSKDVDARSDVWSLGVILFELLTGCTPFQAEAMTDLMVQIATAPAPALSRYRMDVPPRLERAMATCLEKACQRRFATIGELAIALHDFGSRDFAPASVARIVGTLQSAGGRALARPASNSSPPRASLTPLTLSNTEASVTTATWGHTGSQPPVHSGGTRPVALGTALAFVGVVTFGGALFTRTSKAPAAAAGIAATMPAATASAFPVTVLAPPAELSNPPGVDVGSLPLARHATTASPARVQTVVRAPAASPPPAAPASSPLLPAPAPAPPAAPPAAPSAVAAAAAPLAAAPARAASSCDPPFSLDDQGRKHFKRECYLRN